MNILQTGRVLSLTAVVWVAGFWLTGCASSSHVATGSTPEPNYALFYQKPTERQLRAVKESLLRLKVGMTRDVMLRELKPKRLLSINYHGAEAQNTYWLRPGIKIGLHFSNRDPLLVVPDELPHGEPDDRLLDLPEYVWVAGGGDVADPQQAWQKVRIADLP